MATSKGANTYNRQNWEDSVCGTIELLNLIDIRQNNVCLHENAQQVHHLTHYYLF